MQRKHLATLRFLALLFLLPGLAGLVISAFVSTSYLENLPKQPIPSELRMTPRNIHGTVIYQTEEEDRRLTLMEYSSVGIFVVGLTLSLVFLERWGTVRSSELDEEDLASDNASH
jgi:hypothetical protein